MLGLEMYKPIGYC